MPNEFSQKKKNRIADRLNRNLSSEYLSVRNGHGNTKLFYIEGWTLISLANKIFGFDGWSSEIKGFTEEYNETNDGKTAIGYSCVCRVTLKSGVYKEDVGFGSSENQKMKSQAVEKAKKEASTDALKRALRQFGNALGNCCYNKDYLRNIQKHKSSKKEAFDSGELLKYTDFIECNNKEEDSVSFSQGNDISDL
ncbi:DNA repair protein rad52 [Glugoides intestinalis]